MNIRILEQRELLGAMHLVWDVFATRTAPLYSPEGVAEYQSFIKITNIENLYIKKELFIWGAFEGNELHGVGAMYKTGHIAILDVDAAYQNRGVESLLFETMKQFCAQNLGMMRMTVNAAPNTTSLYQGLGFHSNTPEQTRNGVRFVDMDFLISPGDIKRTDKKSQNGLIIGLVVGVGLCVIICCILLFRSLANNIANGLSQFSLNEDYDYYDDFYEEDEFDYDYYDDFFEEDYGEGEEDTQDTSLGAVAVFEADDLSYTVEEDSYYEEESSETSWMCMDINYPVLTELEGEKADEINETIKSYAMQTAENLYLNPSEEVKGFLLEQDYKYVGSQVEYYVTYMSNDLISIVFEDHYFWGSVYAEFQDIRTCTINLKTGDVYEISDIVKLDENFMDAWYDSMKEEAPDADVLDLVELDDFQRVFEGENVDNRYGNAFFLKDGGLEIGLSYHYGDEELIERGWMTAPFTWEDIATYKTDNEMWKIVESDN